MNIIIDARMVEKNLHGIGRYTFELVKRLIKQPNISLKLITNNESLSKEIFEESAKISYLTMKSKFLSPFEIIEFPLILNRYKNDHIFHSTSFSSSPFIRVKSFITIHDLNHLALPQYYSKFHKYYYRFIVKPFSLKCNKIFTVSKFSKDEIVNWLGCNEEKVIVTYNGIDFEKFKVNSKLNEDIKKKYSLPQKYILYIGNLKPHKNLERVLKAFEQIEDKEIKLVINNNNNMELKRIINLLKLTDRVKFIGFVDDKDLSGIYNQSEVFVFPSLYEGFGLPPLEAIASGTKVVTSNNTALGELFSDIAITVNPYSVTEIAKGINTALNIENSKMNIHYLEEKFNWDKLVESVLNEYKRINMNGENK